MKNVNNSLTKTPEFQKTTEILESFVEASLAPTQLRPLIRSGDNPVVNAGEKAHKECMTAMGALFETSSEFKIAFAREAMSGFEKFGKNNNAAAEYMLVASHDGSKVAIHSVYDDTYCEKIADKMKLQARFKTSSRKLKGKKTGEYNYWSVISLIVDAMDEELLNHDGEILNEFAFLGKVSKKVKGFFSRVWKKASSFFKSSTSKMLKFLGVEPEVSNLREITFD